MNINTNTLIPGLLVSLKTTLKGNVSYHTLDAAPDEAVIPSEQSNVAVAAWNTTRVTKDVEEFEAAKKVRSKARALITGVCANSNFGLLCPQARVADLESALADARAICEAFNATARVTRIGCFVITGEIAQNDLEAARAINSEIAEGIEVMRRGCETLDPAMIRDAASKLKDVGQMLTPAMRERVEAGIKLARTEARRLVKSGENAALAVDRQVVDQLAFARSAFLDIDDNGGTIAAPVVETADLDLVSGAESDSGAVATLTAPESAAAELDLDEEQRVALSGDQSEALPAEFDIVDDEPSDDFED